MTLEERYWEKLEEGRRIGIQALILENLEENVDKDKILKKLVKYFSLTEEEAEKYFDLYGNGKKE